MRPMQGSQIDVPTNYLFPTNAVITDRSEFTTDQVPNVAAPFSEYRKYVLNLKEAFSFNRKQQLLLPSTASVVRIVVHVMDEEVSNPESRSSSELVQGVRFLGGMTWAQVAEIFDVSLRAVFDWAAGKTVAGQHHRHLGNVFATLEYIDRGSAEENINLLMGKSQGGVTCFELLKKDQCDLVRDIVGEGLKRPSYKKKLSEEAEKYNAPTHFGHSIEESLFDEDVEIVLTEAPKVHRLKAQKSRA